MSMDLKISYLLDFYGDILTEKQRETIDLYYNQDFSLSEIALNQGITRQGVRHAIKRAESLLVDLEKKLGLASKFIYVNKNVKEILVEAQEIIKYNKDLCVSKEVYEKALKIEEIANNINNNVF